MANKNGGNKYGKMLKNPERIGKGEVQTKEQILSKEPKTTEKNIKEIIEKGPKNKE